MAPVRRQGPSTATIVRVVFTVAGTLLFLYALYLIRSVLTSVLVAAFLAVGLDPAVRRMQNLGLKRGHAVGAIFVSATLFIVAFFAAVVPPLVSQVTTFATHLPEYTQNLAENNPRIEELVARHDIAQRLREATQNAPSIIGGSLGDVLGAAGSIIESFFRALTVLVLTVYFSLNLAAIREGSFRLVPQSKRARVRSVGDRVLEKIGGYIAGNVAVSLIAGVAAFMFLMIAGVPFPIALALWVAIADLIPLVGATLGALPAVVVAFFTSIPVGIAAVVYFTVYQQVENYVIAPRVMTKAVDLSPAAVLLAALIGAALLGFVGALMAIPAAAAVKLVTQEILVPMAEEA